MVRLVRYFPLDLEDRRHPSDLHSPDHLLDQYLREHPGYPEYPEDRHNLLGRQSLWDRCSRLVLPVRYFLWDLSDPDSREYPVVPSAPVHLCRPLDPDTRYHLLNPVVPLVPVRLWVRQDNVQNSVKSIDYHCNLNCSYMHVSDSYQTRPLYLLARVFNGLTIYNPCYKYCMNVWLICYNIQISCFIKRK